MKQDGFLVIKDNDLFNIPKDIDRISIGKTIIIRKNKPRQIQWLNDDGTLNFDLSRNPIYRRMVPPPWETVDHALIITSIMNEDKNSKNKTYIEYGVRDGECIEKIAKYVGKCYGVDMIKYNNKSSNIEMYSSSTDDFSYQKLPGIKFDYAFIDADHSSKQVSIDFDHIYRYINPGGYIFLHDTYPCMEQNLLPTACHDCYKTPLIIRNKYPYIEMLTIPINPGFTIVRK